MIEVTEEMMKQYGEARFAAGFYLALNLLNDDEQAKEIIQAYKELIT